MRHLATFPSAWESTTTVFAAGVDLFARDLAPTKAFDTLGPDFDRVQLIAITTLLLVATLVLRPLVRKRQLHRQWYS